MIFVIDELKKVVLAGLGSAAYTYEKASKVVDDLVEKGKITVEEGKELSQELKKNLKEKGEFVSDKVSKVKPLTKDDLSNALKELNFATKEDLDALKDRISKLEEKSNQ